MGVSPLRLHHAVTPPVPSTLLAIVISGLFLLSYGRNVPLYERRSPLLTTCHGSSLVLSQRCQDMDVLSHARSLRPIHQRRMMIFIMQGALVFSGYLEEESVLYFALKLFLP